MIFTTHYASPLGDILIAECGGALIGLWIAGQDYMSDLHGKSVEERETPLLVRTKAWLSRYFAGERPAIAELPPRPARERVPSRCMESALRHPLRRDDYLRCARARDCRSDRQVPHVRAGRRRRRRAQPHLHHHPLSSRCRNERQPHRIRRRSPDEDCPPRTRGRRYERVLCAETRDETLIQ